MHGKGACMVGGMHGRGDMHSRGDMHGKGGMHGGGTYMARGGHAWQEVCMAGGHEWWIL